MQIRAIVDDRISCLTLKLELVERSS